MFNADILSRPLREHVRQALDITLGIKVYVYGAGDSSFPNTNKSRKVPQMFVTRLASCAHADKNSFYGAVGYD